MSNPYEDEKTSEDEGEGGEETVEGGVAPDPDGELGESPGGAWQGDEEREATKKSAAGRRKRAAGRRAAAAGRVRNLPDVRPPVVRAAVEPRKKAAGKPKIAVRIREIRIPGESERAIEVTAPRSEIFWDEWEVRVDGTYHSRHETDFAQGTVIRLDPGIDGRVTVVGTLDQRPVTRESNPVRLRPATAPSRRPPSAPPTATPIKVARSDRRFFGAAA